MPPRNFPKGIKGNKDVPSFMNIQTEAKSLKEKEPQNLRVQLHDTHKSFTGRAEEEYRHGMDRILSSPDAKDKSLEGLRAAIEEGATRE